MTNNFAVQDCLFISLSVCPSVCTQDVSEIPTYIRMKLGQCAD